MTSTQEGNTVTGTVPSIMVLSGKRRGHCEILSHKTVRIVIIPDSSTRFLEPEDEESQDYHATLHRVANTYELSVRTGHEAWINGEKITGSQILKSGDLIEIDHGGPLFRYRVCPPGMIHVKTLNEVVSDSMNVAHADGATTLGRTSSFFANLFWNLATQTTLWFRIWVIIILFILTISIVGLITQNIQLQKRIASEKSRIEEIEKLMGEYGSTSMDHEELLKLQSEVKEQLTDTFERLGALEEGTGKASRVIAEATPSVVLLMGSFGFVDPYSGKFLYMEETEGKIIRFNMEREGRIMELAFTGTGFIVSETGMILSNQHLVRFPQGDPRTTFLQGRQLDPVILQIIAYFPGVPDPVYVELADIDKEIDLLLLRPIRELKGVKPLIFESKTPQPGDEVFLLGYPLGINAMIARASPELIESITRDGKADFWTVAQGLAEAGYVKPLVTRGIVGQVSDNFVVYDAETTFGGSGGPLLNIDGHVIGINSAIIPEFGGSNMGIQASSAQKFLESSKQVKETSQ